MSEQLGTSQRALRVAIVGSGPSGFYAADALTKAEINVTVDMFDRLPAPYGLVRYGVAPDHAKIKNVIKVYEHISEKENISFLGNVTIGRDISVEQLKKFYDAIIFTNGAETDKKLGIPGEDLAGSYTATEFVAWYNGHPDYVNHKFDLSQEVAVIIGQGNVAMDVCRILGKTVDELKNTDISQHALDVLAESRVKEIHMIGRRGPVQAAFTPTEIREMGELVDCDPVVDPKDLEVSEVSQAELDDSKNAQRKKNFEILQEYASRGKEEKTKKFICHFLKSPIELIGDGKIEKIILEKNLLEGEANKQKARGIGEKKELACGLCFRSVGYRGLPIEGIPFHEQWGSILHEEGRVINENGKIVSGFYTAGWIKRGPSGVVGTNKPDSEETVKHLLEDMDKLTPCETPDTQAVLEFLKQKNIRVINFEDWKKINAAEIEAGQKIGKPREKFVGLEDMLGIVQK